MPSFEYKGISGEKNTYADGIIEAINEDEAAYRLRQKKIIITAIKEVKSNKKKVKEKDSNSSSLSFLDRLGSIKTKEIVLFTKKLSTMSRAGLNILDTLQMARDQVNKFFQVSMQEAQARGEMVPQIDPAAVEAAIAQQIGEILTEVMPSLQPQQQVDPLVAIRQKELENDTTEIQRKTANDQMSFQFNQAKLQQAFDLAQQRSGLQEKIAEDRNDVNIYRINTQASLRK